MRRNNLSPRDCQRFVEGAPAPAPRDPDWQVQAWGTVIVFVLFVLPCIVTVAIVALELAGFLPTP